MAIQQALMVLGVVPPGYETYTASGPHSFVVPPGFTEVSVVSVGGGAGATGGGNDETFIENSYQVTEDYQLSSGKNAVSVGVLQIAANKTVTIPSGRSWVVL